MTLIYPLSSKLLPWAHPSLLALLSSSSERTGERFLSLCLSSHCSEWHCSITRQPHASATGAQESPRQLFMLVRD